MSGTLAIVAFFSGLLFIILIHEAGHYLAARRLGFQVLEYFVGFGPRVWSFRRGEIEYGVKALPLGGYVKIAGMNPYEPVAPEDLPRSYGAKPIWQRALVILAGPGSHFVVAAILFAVWLFVFGDPRSPVPVVGIVDTTLENGQPSPAAAAGLQPGDRIVGVDDLAAPTPDQLLDYSSDHVGQPVVFTIERDGQELEITMIPQEDVVGGETIGRIGIRLGFDKPGLVGAVVGGVKEVGRAIETSVHQITRIFGPEGIGRVFSLLFTDEPRSANDPTSVVGIGQAVGQTGSAGDWGAVLYFLAFVTVFIGLINLLPLPPFDGGHLAVLAIEKVRGKTIDMRKLIPVSAAVMAFFVVFVLATIILDITKPITIAP
ncbi:MAG TPA: M50 family metallopeptidase [Actinomycetota bacterium]|jgi:membrane-associated protease RseP (regulator of RpoE activity)